MAVAGDVTVHLKQGSSTQKRGEVWHRRWPETVRGAGTAGTEVAPDMEA